MNLTIGCVTDKGNYREKNQDGIICRRCQVGEHLLALACVSDGIGSFSQSEIASAMMVSGVASWFDSILKYFPAVMGAKEVVDDLEATLQELNELIYEGRTERNLEIGCTLSLILIIDWEYHIFHVGDSRIYCLRDTLFQLTQDEVILKQINGKEKKLLDNYIGKNRQMHVSHQCGHVNRADMFLLGTDGVCSNLNYENVTGVLSFVSSDEEVEVLCRNLINMVLAMGERDNVSCAIVQVM